MVRSDGRRAGSDGLATVSYLFGVPEVEPEQDEFPLEAGAQIQAPSERDTPISGRPVSTRPAFRDPGPGWYSPPTAEAEPEATVGEQPPAGAVAAARAFLSTVEKTVDTIGEGTVDTNGGHTDGDDTSGEETGGSASVKSGVRFVEEDDDESDSATGRKTPPPVRQASLNALARKGMSSAEMANLLEAREVDPDEAAAEVERLEGVGLLDDRVLAEHLVRTLQDRKGLGRSAINAELRRRQVDQAAIDEVLETVDVDDELERCIEVAAKRASQLSSYDHTTAERRLSAYLMRRGYAGSVISAAIAQTLGPAGPRFR